MGKEVEPTPVMGSKAPLPTSIEEGEEGLVGVKEIPDPKPM